jgi:D-alanyl-D-alanine dipeptidase
VIKVDDKNIITYTTQYLQEEVYEKLKRVAKNHKIILYEGYRPIEKQIAMFNKFKEEHPDMSDEQVHKYIAIPSKAVHVTGGAVDIALLDKDMGSDYLCFDGTQATEYYINDEVKANRELLCSLMKDEGFINFYNEWWHFEYGTDYWARLTGNKQIYFNGGKEDE